MYEVRTVVLVYYANEISTKKKNKTKQNKTKGLLMGNDRR